MKFFEHQKKARTATIKLLLLFGFSVILVSGFMSAALIFVFSKPIKAWIIKRNYGEYISTFDLYFSPFIWLTLFFIVFILILSAMRLGELRRGGGDFVAESLGGRLLGSYREAQLLNIVEEMSIASGLPVPRVYLIEEQSINAFAAGWTTSDAVIDVISGCVSALTREEMQGVIAHEFSHILNGDMRLNMRLMAAIHGIAFFAEWGKTTKLAALAKEPVDKALLFLAGFLIFIIGWVGLLCAKIIQAAVSRQREFLADASAVQFTRNSDGIVGALQKIECAAEGSIIHHSYAFETSHLFFGDIDSKAEALLASHPSIPERIARIKGVRFVPKEKTNASSDTEVKARVTQSAKPQLQTVFFSDELIHSVGTIRLSTQSAPRLLVISLEERCRDTAGALAVFYSILLPVEHLKRETLRRSVAQQIDPIIASVLQKIDADLLQLNRPQLFKLLSLALPTLKMLSQTQAAAALKTASSLIEIDGYMNFFELCIWQLAKKGLKHGQLPDLPKLPIGSAVGMSFGLFAALSNQSDLAYQKAIEAANIKDCPTANPIKKINDFKWFDAVFDTLAQASFGIKEKILTGCVAAVLADGNISEDESVLLQAFCLAMDVPLPPMQAVW